MGLSARALFVYGSLIASRTSRQVVAQHSGLKGHVDDQVVVLRHEEDRVSRARYPACGRCALEGDDAEHINFLALQLRGNTGILALCRGIKNWGRRVHNPATTWQRKYAASKSGDCVHESMLRRPSIYGVNENGPSTGRRWGRCSTGEGVCGCCCILLGTRTVLSLVNGEKERESPLTYRCRSQPRHRCQKSSSLHLCHESGLPKSARRAPGSSKNHLVGTQTFKLLSS